MDQVMTDVDSDPNALLNQPNEILIRIFGFLDELDLPFVRLVHPLFNQLIKTDSSLNQTLNLLQDDSINCHFNELSHKPSTQHCKMAYRYFTQCASSFSDRSKYKDVPIFDILIHLFDDDVSFLSMFPHPNKDHGFISRIMRQRKDQYLLHLLNVDKDFVRSGFSGNILDTKRFDLLQLHPKFDKRFNKDVRLGTWQRNFGGFDDNVERFAEYINRFLLWYNELKMNQKQGLFDVLAKKYFSPVEMKNETQIDPLFHLFKSLKHIDSNLSNIIVSSDSGEMFESVTCAFSATILNLIDFQSLLFQTFHDKKFKLAAHFFEQGFLEFYQFTDKSLKINDVARFVAHNQSIKCIKWFFGATDPEDSQVLIKAFLELDNPSFDVLQLIVNEYNLCHPDFSITLIDAFHHGHIPVGFLSSVIHEIDDNHLSYFCDYNRSNWTNHQLFTLDFFDKRILNFFYCIDDGSIFYFPNLKRSRSCPISINESKELHQFGKKSASWINYTQTLAESFTIVDKISKLSILCAIILTQNLKLSLPLIPNCWNLIKIFEWYENWHIRYKMNLDWCIVVNYMRKKSLPFLKFDQTISFFSQRSINIRQYLQ